MKYDEALAYLQRRINYEQRGMPDAGDLRLDRIAKLLSLLGDPHRAYPVVHIAGTKGKGSVATMVASLLGSKGVKVGLHTSPHMHRLEERFCVDGEVPAPAVLLDLVETVQPFVETLDERLPTEQPKLTFFEITTAMMFLHFARQRVDWGVVEVGMGGRLDCTNVVDPAVAVITSISLDHVKQLGEDLGAIAGEKAGILKPGRPAISGVAEQPARGIVEARAAAVAAPLRQIGTDFAFTYRSNGADGGRLDFQSWRSSRKDVGLSLVGRHQAVNCAVALAAVDVLEEAGSISSPSLAGLENVRLAGRIEIIARFPVLLILDAAHNGASARALADAVREIESVAGPRILIFGATRDKDWPAMIETLAPEFDAIVWTQYRNNSRAVPVEQLAAVNLDPAKPVWATSDPESAWRRASMLVHPGRKNAAPNGMVCATGSFFLAAEMREIMQSGVLEAI